MTLPDYLQGVPLDCLPMQHSKLSDALAQAVSMPSIYDEAAVQPLILQSLLRQEVALGRIADALEALAADNAPDADPPKRTRSRKGA